jgi:C4-dicarboxylate-specific signal transduction histidine kinase
MEKTDNVTPPPEHQPCHEIIREHEALKSRHTEIIQAEKITALGEMTAGLIHEINSPLSAIHNALDVSIRGIRKVVEMIENAGGGVACADERDRICRVLAMLEENHATASEASARMSKIVGRLKRFTALDEPSRQLIDLPESIDNTISLLGHELPQRIRVTRHFAPTPRVVGDPSELNLVFWNVIKNAAQSIDDDGDIWISTRDDGDHVVVEITDTGRGIPAERLSTLFSPSFTTHKAAVRLNTGLPISYNILRRNEGEIAISSEPGNGTTVTVKLPAAR